MPSNQNKPNIATIIGISLISYFFGFCLLHFIYLYLLQKPLNVMAVTVFSVGFIASMVYQHESKN